MALRLRSLIALGIIPLAGAISLGCGSSESSDESPGAPQSDASSEATPNKDGSPQDGQVETDVAVKDVSFADTTEDAPAQEASAPDDAQLDVEQPGDAMPDQTGQDAGEDAPAEAGDQDAEPDVGETDAEQEAAADAADEPVVDAPEEPVQDAAPEAEPEAGEDASAEAGEEAGPEAGEDVSADAVADATEEEAAVDCGGGCKSNEECFNGVCVQKCTTDEDCWNDKACDQTKKLCLAWPVPLFDPMCAFVAPAGAFSPSTRCEFSTPPPGDPFPNHRDVQATPIVVNLQQGTTSTPSIIVPFTANIPGSYSEGLGVIRVLRGNDCTIEQNLGGTDVDGDGVVDWIASPAPVAAADLDGDNSAEVVAFGGDGSMLAFTRKFGTWSLLWKARTIQNGPVFVDPLYSWTPSRSNNWAGPSIYDLDDDASPEIVREGYVFGSNGVLRAALPAGYTKYNVGLNPVMANLDGDPAIELANGQYIWEFSAGGWKVEDYFKPAAGASAGLVAIADFGAFGQGLPPKSPEIAVVRSGQVAIYAADGSYALSPRLVPGGGGGNPTVADYDGDGLPELGVAGADFYTVFDIDCTSAPRAGGTCTSVNRCDNALGVPGACPAGVLWSRKTQDHSSNITGSSVFDFEADGKSEVVYADECFTRVYSGTDGEVLFSQYRSSCTWYENPVIADVDGNFRADLVVPSNLACSDGVNGIACGGLDANGVDSQFAGIHCQTDGDCVSGTCSSGLCRCTTTAQCCPQQDNAKCIEYGFKCAPPPSGTPGSGNTCRAAHPHGVQGIRVYSDAQDKWVRSRMIWNQHAYAVTHVNENGTVPRTSEWKNNWEEPGLNNFRQNVGGTATPQATADTTVQGGIGFSCSGSGAELAANLCNRGANSLGAGMSVSFTNGGTLLCEGKSTKVLAPGECETLKCTWASPPNSQATAADVTLTADASNSVTECKEGNNKGTISGVFCSN